MPYDSTAIFSPFFAAYTHAGSMMVLRVEGRSAAGDMLVHVETGAYGAIVLADGRVVGHYGDYRGTLDAPCWQGVLPYAVRNPGIEEGANGLIAWVENEIAQGRATPPKPHARITTDLVRALAQRLAHFEPDSPLVARAQDALGLS